MKVLESPRTLWRTSVERMLTTQYPTAIVTMKVRISSERFLCVLPLILLLCECSVCFVSDYAKKTYSCSLFFLIFPGNGDRCEHTAAAVQLGRRLPTSVAVSPCGMLSYEGLLLLFISIFIKSTALHHYLRI